MLVKSLVNTTCMLCYYSKSTDPPGEGGGIKVWNTKTTDLGWNNKTLVKLPQVSMVHIFFKKQRKPKKQGGGGLGGTLRLIISSSGTMVISCKHFSKCL